MHLAILVFTPVESIDHNRHYGMLLLRFGYKRHDGIFSLSLSLHTHTHTHTLVTCINHSEVNQLPYCEYSEVAYEEAHKGKILGKDGGQEEKGATEDEMFGWHHQLNGHEFKTTPGDSWQIDRRTGKPGVLQPMGWQRVRHNRVTKQQQ